MGNTYSISLTGAGVNGACGALFPIVTIQGLFCFLQNSSSNDS